MYSHLFRATCDSHRFGEQRGTGDNLLGAETVRINDDLMESAELL